MVTLLPLTLAALAATPLNPTPVNSFQVRVVVDGTLELVHTRQGPNLGRLRYVSDGAVIVRRSDTEYVSATRTAGGSILRNMPPAAPDGRPVGDDQWTETIDHILGRARSGEDILVADTIDGIAAARATVTANANECAGLPRRTITVWLSQAHFLPLRVHVRAIAGGKLLNRYEYRYRGVNTTFPATLFTPPTTLGPGRVLLDGRFRRMSAVAASGPLPYVPREPATMLQGYRRVASGWAPRGQRLGPEGSLAPLPWLYQAVWRAGREHVDFTMRVSGADWQSDPFGRECQFVTQEPVTIGGQPGIFGTGPESTPHLYWRSGKLLYTLSGPHSKEMLLSIANSMRKPVPPLY